MTSKMFLSPPHFTGSEKEYIDIALSKENGNLNIIFFEKNLENYLG